MKKQAKNRTILSVIFLISGIALSVVGIYFFHMQYLCYRYTLLRFILGAVICLGGALISLPPGKSGDKKKTVFS